MSKKKQDRSEAAMQAIIEHPFEKGLLESVEKEMKTWAYFVCNNPEANKVMAAIIIKAADDFRTGGKLMDRETGRKIDLFDPKTYQS